MSDGNREGQLFDETGIRFSVQDVPIDRVLTAIFHQLLMIRTETATHLSITAFEQMSEEQRASWSEEKGRVAKTIAEEIERDLRGE